MVLTPTQVVLLSASLFVGIVASSVAFKYLTDNKFREDFANSDRSKFFKSIAPKLKEQEMQEDYSDVAAYAPLDDTGYEGNN